MPNLLASCAEHFEAKDLYSVLNIPKSATDAEVKRAYHKGSLRYHPDRVKEDEKDEATKKFQTLGKVYSILSDKEKRAVYDESGEIDEEDEPEDRDWDKYWRQLFPKITLDDIKKFEEAYKGSEEELEDLKAAYTQYSGDMDRIMESVLCCTYEDEDRFQDLLRNLIKSGELPSLAKFSRETKAKKENRKKRMQKEAAEADELSKELGLGEGEDELKKIIQKRQESRQKNLVDHLEEKYGKKGKGKAASKKKPADEECEDNGDNVTAKTSRAKKNGKASKELDSDNEVSEEEKPVTSKRGRKTAADKKPSAETVKESKAPRGKRGGAVDKAAGPDVDTKQRSRRGVASKEPNYIDNSSSDDTEEKIVKPKGRKAATKVPVASDSDEAEVEAEKKSVAKPKRGAAKQTQKPDSKQEVETTKGNKSARNKKGVTKPAKSLEVEDDEDPKAKGDEEQEPRSDEDETNIQSNGCGDYVDENETAKTKRDTSQKNTAKSNEKLEPATKKTKMEVKSKKVKK